MTQRSNSCIQIACHGFVSACQLILVLTSQTRSNEKSCYDEMMVAQIHIKLREIGIAEVFILATLNCRL